MTKIFRTQVEVAPYDFSFNHKNRGFMVGSCFTDSIGEKLIERLIPMCKNPLGVVYNPASIVNLLERLENKTLFTEADLFLQHGLYGTFEAHSSFSDCSRTQLLENLNRTVCESSEKLTGADYVMITLGTSWVYRNRDTGRIVSNCHKYPASQFERYALGCGDIYRLFSELLGGSSHWRTKKIIFTVSPVRHLKDGFSENQRSKASLLLAVEELRRSFPNVYYFPAYEIMMDDLRDYRFYKEDMIHPSDTAVEYIWEKFRDAVFDDDTRALFSRIERLVLAMHHRPFGPDTEAHRKFRHAMLENVDALAEKYPHIDFTVLSDYFGDTHLSCVRRTYD